MKGLARLSNLQNRTQLSQERAPLGLGLGLLFASQRRTLGVYRRSKCFAWGLFVY
jgi:hypothetical protein